MRRQRSHLIWHRRDRLSPSPPPPTPTEQKTAPHRPRIPAAGQRCVAAHARLPVESLVLGSGRGLPGHAASQPARGRRSPCLAARKRSAEPPLPKHQQHRSSRRLSRIRGQGAAARSHREAREGWPLPPRAREASPGRSQMPRRAGRGASAWQRAPGSPPPHVRRGRRARAAGRGRVRQAGRQGEGARRCRTPAIRSPSPWRPTSGPLPPTRGRAQAWRAKPQPRRGPSLLRSELPLPFLARAGANHESDEARRERVRSELCQARRGLGLDVRPAGRVARRPQAERGGWPRGAN